MFDFIKIANEIKFARIKDDLEILKNNVGNYIHFSDSERFGISFHKNIQPGNPRGLYGFKLTKDMVDSFFDKKFHGLMHGYYEKKYIYIFKPSGNILNLDKLNQEDLFKQIKQFVINKYKSLSVDNDSAKFVLDNIKYYNFKDFGSIWAVFRKLYEELKWLGFAKNEHSFVNIILRGVGYSAIETNNYGFEDGIESQICVLTPEHINLIHQINNPLYGNSISVPKEINEFSDEDKEKMNELGLTEEDLEDLF